MRFTKPGRCSFCHQDTEVFIVPDTLNEKELRCCIPCMHRFNERHERQLSEARERLRGGSQGSTRTEKYGIPKKKEDPFLRLLEQVVVQDRQKRAQAKSALHAKNKAVGKR